MTVPKLVCLAGAVALAACGETPYDPRGVDHDETLLSVSATGEAETRPDQARFEAGINNWAANARAASDANAADIREIVAALREACEFCDQPENRAHIAATLARPEYVGVPEDILKRGLAGQLDCGNDITRRIGDFFVFHRDGANDPVGKQAAWAMALIRASGLCTEPSAISFATTRGIYRSELFQTAVGNPPPVRAARSTEAVAAAA